MFILLFKEMLRSPAELLYDKLSGIVCLLKPADMKMQHFFTIIQERLASGIAFKQMKMMNKITLFSFQSNALSGTDESCGYST